MNKFGQLAKQAQHAKETKEDTPAKKATKPRRAKAEAPVGQAPTVTETQEIMVTRPVGKRSKDGYTQVSAYIPRETHIRVKAALLTDADNRDFSDLLSDLLAAWLANPVGK